MSATSLLLPVPPLAGPELSGRQRAALDDEAALAACTTWQRGADGQREARTRLFLQGLHCAVCAGIIEAALRCVDGVRAAQVNSATERAEGLESRAHARVGSDRGSAARRLPGLPR